MTFEDPLNCLLKIASRSCATSPQSSEWPAPTEAEQLWANPEGVPAPGQPAPQCLSRDCLWGCWGGQSRRGPRGRALGRQGRWGRQALRPDSVSLSLCLPFCPSQIVPQASREPTGPEMAELSDLGPGDSPCQGPATGVACAQDTHPVPRRLAHVKDDRLAGGSGPPPEAGSSARRPVSHACKSASPRRPGSPRAACGSMRPPTLHAPWGQVPGVCRVQRADFLEEAATERLQPKRIISVHKLLSPADGPQKHWGRRRPKPDARPLGLHWLVTSLPLHALREAWLPPHSPGLPRRTCVCDRAPARPLPLGTRRGSALPCSAL